MKFNNETLRIAVKEWLKDETKAEAKYGHISNWDVSNVTDMSEMFSSMESLAFNQPIGDWDVSSVTDMSKMFKEATSFNQDLSAWNLTKKTFHENGNLYTETEVDGSGQRNGATSPENGIELKEFTVFLIPKKGDTLVVFKTDKSNLKGFEHFSDTEFLLSEISYRDAINLTGDDEIDLKKYPPIMLDGSHSQSLLDILKEWIPDKKFVMVYRWNRLHEENCDYEDYLSEFETGVFSEDDSFDSFEDYSREINYTREEVAVLGHFDKIFITGKKSDSDEPGQEITKFPGSATREFVGLHSPFDYDELRIFEEEVFNNLNVEIDNEMMDIEGQKFPIAKKLILDVDKYKKLKLSPSL